MSLRGCFLQMPQNSNQRGLMRRVWEIFLHTKTKVMKSSLMEALLSVDESDFNPSMKNKKYTISTNIGPCMPIPHEL